jgi:outer membrane protein assembly factor BamE (lipoprotein component of BamABCDE complex)
MVPVPTGEDKVLAGKPVEEEQLAFLTPRATTKQEVLEHLGNPIVIWEDARVFVYNWKMRQGILFWAAGAYYTGGAGMTDIPKHYLLLIQFDEQDLVLHFERAVCPMHKSYSECLTEWVRNAAATSPRNTPDKME